MPFDIRAARDEGFTDDDIKSFLNEKFDVDNALKSGLSLDDMAEGYDIDPPDEFGSWLGATAEVESGGDYSAIGPRIDTGKHRGERALGKYQIMPNLHFSKVGLDPSRLEDRHKFLNDPDIQEELGEIVGRECWEKSGGDPQKATACYYGSGSDREVPTAGGQKMPTGTGQWEKVKSKMRPPEPPLKQPEAEQIDMFEPESTFDPEGSGYDYETAEKSGIKPDETGHWPSRDPNTGQLLKGRKHETWHKTLKGEEESGYEIFQGEDGKYYSRKVPQKGLTAKDVAKGIGKGFLEVPKYGIQSLANALGRTGMNLGDIIEYGGEKLDIDRMANLGRKIHDVYKERPAVKAGTPEDIAGSVAENPELMLDPKWWSWNVNQMAPSLGLALGAGLTGGGVVKVMGKALKLAPKVIARLSALGTSITGGLAGGVLEGSSTYREMKDGGATEEEAQAAAEMMTGASAALNAISFGTMLSKAKISKPLKAMIAGATEAITEWAEEPAEVVAKRTAKGTIQDVPETVTDAVQAIKEGMNVVGPSFLLGALGGSADISVSTPETQTTEAKEAPAEITQDKPLTEENFDREGAKAAGFTDEEINQFLAEEGKVEKEPEVAPEKPKGESVKVDDTKEAVAVLDKEVERQKAAGSELKKADEQLEKTLYGGPERRTVIKGGEYKGPERRKRPVKKEPVAKKPGFYLSF